MTGRGSGRLIHTYVLHPHRYRTSREFRTYIPSSPNPTVTLGLSLSTSSPTLSPSSAEPFHIVVTVRILETPQPDAPITLQTHPTPLDGLHNRSFGDIVNVSDSTKRIELFPRTWTQYKWDEQDLRNGWDFTTIPAKGKGEAVFKHEVPRGKIEAAGLERGERYRVKVTDKCLGARWWCFKGEEELEGVRLVAYRSGEDLRAEREGFDEEELRREEEEKREKYGPGKTEMGEEPRQLAMVLEKGEVEFEIV